MKGCYGTNSARNGKARVGQTTAEITMFLMAFVLAGTVFKLFGIGQ